MSEWSPDLIGRDYELSRIAALFSDHPPLPRVLILTGEPGIGKTALLNSAAQLASSYAHVLRCAGAEFENDIAYSGLNQLLLPFSAEIDLLTSDQRDTLRAAAGMVSGTTPGELIVVSSLRALLSTMAGGQPVVVIIDDLQWLDRMSATVLGLLARRLDGSSIAMLAALRTGEATYFANQDLPSIHVGPLQYTHSRTLLATRFPDLGDGHREAALAQAQGNPLALSVFPRVLHDNGEYLDEWPMLPLSRRLTDTFSAKISRLPPKTRGALLMVALDANGGAATLASGTSSALDVAQSAGIVIYASAGREVRFGHPLMAMAAVEMATARQRRDAHRALAAVVEDPVRRAWHRLRAALGPDEDAAAEIERAAEVALRRADVVGAVNLFTRSAELSPDHASKARRLIVAARVAGEVAGHLDEASTLIDTARTIGTDPVGSLSEAIAGARQLMNAGGAVDTARSLIARAIETHVRTEEFAAENDELIEALNVLCILAWEVGSDKGWQPILRFVERLATPVPELLSLTIGLLYDPARTATDHLPALDQAIARLGRDTDPLYTVLLVKATAYVDRVGDCRDALWRIVDNGRRGGAVACAMHALVQLCADAWMAGNWDDVSRLAAEVTSLGDAHGYRRYAWIVEGYFCAMVGVARGREDDSLRQAVRTAEWASARGSLCSQQFLQHVRALNALGNSDFASAFEAICSVFTPGRLPAGAPNSLWMLLDFTEAAQRSGHDDAALAHVRAMRESVLGQVSPRLAMVVAASTALIAETSLATDLFEEALHIPGAPRFPFDYARVHLLFGEHLRRARSMTRSRMHLEVAASLFDDLGAKPWQDRAAAELRATSARRPNSPGSVLTPQEREIALLAASGLSNKEIGQRLVVSPRTVGVHLYRVFPKLGISSRAALRDALKRAGIESSERRDGAPRGEAWLTP